MPIVPADIERYAEYVSSKESELLRELRGRTEEKMEHTEMLSGPLVGGLLAALVRLTGARRVLEIGTFTGYSALWMAGALPQDGELYTCDYNERYISFARQWFEKSPHGGKITQVEGPALNTIPGIGGAFDLVFLDADKSAYPDYYDLLLPRLRLGGLLLIDNTLWSGRVLEDPDKQDEETRAIDTLNRRAAADGRVEQTLLPIRDGLSLIQKREPA